MTYVQLRSAGFPNVHVRLDGSGVTHFLPPGGGVVNCQYGAGSLETFTRVDNTDGTVSFRSLPYNNVFLRMDGTGVIQPTGAGGGIVNAQYTAGPLEKFKIVSNDDGTSSIKSTAYNNVFLRTDGNGVTAFSPSGAGTVNCQFGIGHYEKLILCSCPTHDQVNAAIDQFTRAFPQQATQINNNRQRIMEACCPPFISTPPVFDSASLPPRLLKIQPRAEALNACDTAILNIIMDAIGMALSVVGFRLSGAVRESIFHTISRSPFTRLQVVLERLCIAWNQGGMARAHAFYEFFSKDLGCVRPFLRCVQCAL
jgi:hypothetical protein